MRIGPPTVLVTVGDSTDFGKSPISSRVYTLYRTVSRLLHPPHMAYERICDLNGSKENWHVEVRLCRIWEAVDFKNNNEVFALEMVFADDKVPTPIS